MQQAQQSYNFVPGLALMLLLVGAGTAQAGIAVRDAPEPLLQDGTSGACDPGLAGPDYVPGVDVTGNPVVTADLARGKNPVPDEIFVPLARKGHHGRSGEGPVAALDGRGLESILNPAPACPAKAR